MNEYTAPGAPPDHTLGTEQKGVIGSLVKRKGTVNKSRICRPNPNVLMQRIDHRPKLSLIQKWRRTSTVVRRTSGPVSSAITARTRWMLTWPRNWWSVSSPLCRKDERNMVRRRQVDNCWICPAARDFAANTTSDHGDTVGTDCDNEYGVRVRHRWSNARTSGSV